MRLRNDRRELRQREGRERQEIWDTLSPTEKLTVLDARLGKGNGAKRQRTKLSPSPAQ